MRQYSPNSDFPNSFFDLNTNHSHCYLTSRYDFLGRPLCSKERTIYYKKTRGPCDRAAEMETEGLIYNIQRFSLYDGPGIRTVVFFQGCNLRCPWCHNPESISPDKQLMFQPEKCIGCGECFHRCPEKAHYIGANGEHVVDAERCINTFDCVDSCYAEALTIVGQEVDAGYVEKSIMADLPYYQKSSGGATFSGGECMLQIDFLRELLVFCNRNSIHTAIDTAGNVPWSAFEQIMDYTDLFLYDLKAASNEVHKELTNVPNRRILANLRALAATGKRIHIRIPFVPGANDGEIEGIADIIAPLDVEAVYVLPYHQMGLSKQRSIFGGPSAREFRVPEEHDLDDAVTLLRSREIPAHINDA